MKMNSDVQIRYEGMKALRKMLGLVESEKFISLIKNESFNYTEWQRDLWAGKSVDEIFETAKKFHDKDFNED